MEPLWQIIIGFTLAFLLHEITQQMNLCFVIFLQFFPKLGKKSELRSTYSNEPLDASQK